MENSNFKNEIHSGFVRLLSCAATGKKAQNAEYSPEIWEGIFCLALSQKLLPFVFGAVYDCSDSKKHPDLFEKYKKICLTQVRNQAVAEADFLNYYSLLKNNGLEPCVVKGLLCSRLYKNKSFRLSGDDDLFLGFDFQKCRNVLKNNGFFEKNADSDHDMWETSFVCPNSRTLEVHKLLFDPEDEILNSYFEYNNLKKIRCDGVLTLEPTDHFLYLLLHAFNHFVRGGIGIRQAWDVSLWMAEYAGEMDLNVLKQKLLDARAFVFSCAMLRVGKEVFCVDLHLPEDWRFEGEVSSLIEDMLSGGVYGSADGDRLHSSTVTLAAYRNGKKGKKLSRISAVFPPLSYMKNRYPYLKKFPVFLPFAWVGRLCSYGVETLFRKKSSASRTMSIANSRLSLLEKYGIIKK